LKKEIILTAVVFLGVGFLAGYAYKAQYGLNTPESQMPAQMPSSTPAAAPVSFPAMPGVADNGSQAARGLPQGHPSLDYATTVKFFEDAITKEPSNPKLPLDLANYLYDQRRFQEAIPWYEKALALDPRNINARTDLGTAYFDLGKTDDAIAQYRKSLAEDPNHENTLFNMVVVNMSGKRDPVAARQYLERLRKVNPNHEGLAGLTQELQAGGALSGN